VRSAAETPQLLTPVNPAGCLPDMGPDGTLEAGAREATELMGLVLRYH